MSRARRRFAGEHRRSIDARERQRFLDAFAVAAKTGELARLEQLLAADMAGGEVARAAADSTREGSDVRIAA